MGISEQRLAGKMDRYGFVILFLVTLAVYFPALSNYFINDDFIHLNFVKTFKGNYLDFLFPHLRPSDVVTGARYEPFHIYFYALLYQCLKAFFPAYQLLHIILHAFNAFLIFKVGRKINTPSTGAFAGALFFCVYRLNSQNVLWYASLFCTFAFSVMLLVFLLFLKDDRRTGFGSAVLFLLASFLTLRAPQYLLLAGAYLWVFRKELSAQGMLGQKAKVLLGYAIICSVSVLCNAISWHYFPNAVPGFKLDFFGLAAFFMNLIFPYESGILMKIIAVLLAVSAVIINRKDRVCVFLSAAIFLNALFWFVLFSAAHFPYAPRYSYMAAALFSLLLGHLLSKGMQSTSRLRGFAAVGLAVSFIAANGYLLISQDIVWFKYLSLRGKKLEQLARLPGSERKKVFIKDDFFSEDPNLDYFKDKLEFVGTAPSLENDVYSVDLERGKHVKYFGYDFGKQYWFQPWFIKKTCDEKTPWC